ncbi:MAG: OmpA family protein [Candidatus Kapaibacteriota bacterium]
MLGISFCRNTIRLFFVTFSVLLLCAFSLLKGQSLRPTSQKQSIFMPELMTNRRLDYLADATAVGWNPALLGVRPYFDLTLATSVSGNESSSSAKFGIFTKFLGLGLGYASNPAIRRSGGEFYIGYGTPLIDDVLWGGAGFRMSFAGGGYFDYNASILYKPLPGLLLSASATTMKMDEDTGTDVGYIRLAPGMVQVVGSAAYSITPDITALAMFRSGSWSFPAQPSLDVGVSWGMLNSSVVMTGNISLLQPAARLGFEVNSDIIDLGYVLGVTPVSPMEHTIIAHFSGDKAHTLGQLRGKRLDDEYCPGSINTAFDDPAVFLAALPRLNPILAESFADMGLTRDSAAFFTALRTRFYNTPHATEVLAKPDAFNISTVKQHRCELKSTVYSRFPLVTTIVRVTDSLGRSVQGLDASDFVVRGASGKPAESIIAVQRLDTTIAVPVDVVMLIDCSGSMREKIKEVRANIEFFARELQRSGADARLGGILYGIDIIDVLQPTDRLDRFDEFLARAEATQRDEYTPNALDELAGMKFRPGAERIGIVISDEIMYSGRRPALREVLALRELWDKHISLVKIVKPCENNGVPTAYLTLGREYDIAKPFTDVLTHIGRETAMLYAVTTAPPALSKTTQFAGVVRRTDGSPVLASLALTDAESNVIGPFRTRADGTFAQAIIEGRKYRMVVRSESDNALGVVMRTLDASRASLGDTLRQEILLLSRTVLRGIVLDDTGAPLQADIHIRDNLGYELPLVSMDRKALAQNRGQFDAPIVSGRKYTVKITPTSVTQYESPEYEVNTHGIRAGDTLEQRFTVFRLTPFVTIQGRVRFDDESVQEEASRNLRGIPIVVKNQANNDILVRTETNDEGVYSFRLAKGVSAEVRIESRGEFGAERFRMFYRKTDTLSVTQAITTLKKQRIDEDAAEENRARTVLRTTLTESMRRNTSISRAPEIVAISDTVTNESAVLDVPKRKVRMPEISVVRLSFADTKDVKPLSIDSNGVPLNRPFAEELDRLAAEIKGVAGQLAKVVIVGHTDETASDDANRAEGWQRAEYVVKELIQRGVAESLIVSTSSGNKQLLERRPKESAALYRARCRRVEVMKIWRAE